MKEIKDLLCEEIEREIENLENLEPGTQEHEKAVESLTKLYKLKMEEDTNSNEKKKLDKDSIIHYIQFSIDAAGIILPLVFYGTWMNKGLKFEQTGTFTSTTFRGLFQKFKTTK